MLGRLIRVPQQQRIVSTNWPAQRAAAQRPACTRLGYAVNPFAGQISRNRQVERKAKQSDYFKRAEDARKAGQVFHADTIIEMVLELNKKDATIEELREELDQTRDKLAQRSRALLSSDPTDLSIVPIFYPAMAAELRGDRFNAFGLLAMVEAQEYACFKEDDMLRKEIMDCCEPDFEPSSLYDVLSFLWEYILRTHPGLSHRVEQVCGYGLSSSDAAELLAGLHGQLSPLRLSLSSLQAASTSEVVVGVPYPLNQQDAGLLQAVSEELCAINVKIVPYTRGQWSEDFMKRKEAESKAKFGGAAQPGP